MYKAFYGLREKPFNLTPDPRFLYLSEKHKEAFAHLLYGIRSRSGFVMVTGEIGTGKTTICRNLLNQLDEDTELAFIFNPMLSPLELLKKIVSEFGIDAKGSNALDLTEELNEYLLEAAAKGKNCVLLIDEAQNLEPGVLEQIRLLSNLETETEKLLQIVLIGQPELGEKLALHELRQLNQRITARYHLKPLSEKEVMQYVAYRLHVAGGRRKVKFARSAVRAVYKISKGTPRVINALCDRALLIGFTKEIHTITAGIVNRAYREIRGDAIFGRAKPKWTLRQMLRSPLAAVAVLCILAGVYLNSATVQSETKALLYRLAEALPEAGTARIPLAANIAEAKVESAEGSEPGAAAQEATEATDAGEATPVAGLATPPAEAADPAKSQAPKPQSEAPSHSLESALSEMDTAATDAAALRGLLAAWNKEPAGKLPENLTDAALDAFLRNQHWSYDRLKPALGQLIALDLPALVKVVVAGESRWVAITHADDSSLTIATADTPLKVGRSEFQSVFAAEAIVPWEDPSPGAPTLRAGHENTLVAELKDKLRRLNRLRAENTSGTYDVETASAVSRIQAETSLEVDGIAGQQVRMVLSSWLKDGNTPSLTGKSTPPKPTVVAKQTPASPGASKETAEEVAKPRPKTTREEPAANEKPANTEGDENATPKPISEVQTEAEKTVEEPESPAGDTAETAVTNAPEVTADDNTPEIVPESTHETPVKTAPEPADSEKAGAGEAVAAQDTAAPDSSKPAPAAEQPEAVAADAETGTAEPATVTLTNVVHDGTAAEGTAAESAAAGTANPDAGEDTSNAQKETVIPVAPATTTQLVVVELDDPGSVSPAEKTPAADPEKSEG